MLYCFTLIEVCSSFKKVCRINLLNNPNSENNSRSKVCEQVLMFLGQPQCSYSIAFNLQATSKPFAHLSDHYEAFSLIF